MNTPASPVRPALASLALLALVTTLPARAAVIEQTVSTSSSGGITWSGAIWGTPADVATAGNDYVSDGGAVAELRTGGTFDGDSLTLQNNAVLVLKGNVSENFILKSGGYFTAGTAVTIGGTLLVDAGETGGLQTTASYRLTLNAVVSGGGSIHLSQASGATVRTVTVGNDANTFSGTWVVENTSLVMAKSNVLGSAGIELAGGTLATGGFSDTLGTLSLSASSSIDLGDGASSLVFADSSAAAWGDSFSLSVLNYTEGTDSIRFGTGAGGLTADQLSRITINGNSATLDADGYLTLAAIPEPAACALLAGLGALGLVPLLRNRRA